MLTYLGDILCTEYSVHSGANRSPVPTYLPTYLPTSYLPYLLLVESNAFTHPPFWVPFFPGRA
jgi:hypothetical protein